MKRITILLLVVSVIPIQLTAQDTQQAKNKATQTNSVVNVPNDCSVVAGNVKSLTVDFLDERSTISFSSAAGNTGCLGLGSPCTSYKQCCSRLCSTRSHTCCGLHSANCTANDQCCSGHCIISAHRCL